MTSSSSMVRGDTYSLGYFMQFFNPEGLHGRSHDASDESELFRAQRVVMGMHALMRRDWHPGDCTPLPGITSIAKNMLTLCDLSPLDSVESSSHSYSHSSLIQELLSRKKLLDVSQYFGELTLKQYRHHHYFWSAHLLREPENRVFVFDPTGIPTDFGRKNETIRPYFGLSAYAPEMHKAIYRDAVEPDEQGVSEFPKNFRP